MKIITNISLLLLLFVQSFGFRVRHLLGGGDTIIFLRKQGIDGVAAIDILSTATTQELHEQIKQHFGIPDTKKLILKIGGQALPNEDTVADLGITAETIIDVETEDLKIFAMAVHYAKSRVSPPSAPFEVTKISVDDFGKEVLQKMDKSLNIGDFAGVYSPDDDLWIQQLKHRINRFFGADYTVTYVEPFSHMNFNTQTSFKDFTVQLREIGLRPVIVMDDNNAGVGDGVGAGVGDSVSELLGDGAGDGAGVGAGVGEGEMVKNLLSSIGLNQYFKNFVDNGWDDMKTLIHLGESELLEMGITKRGHQKKILRKIKEYLL